MCLLLAYDVMSTTSRKIATHLYGVRGGGGAGGSESVLVDGMVYWGKYWVKIVPSKSKGRVERNLRIERFTLNFIEKNVGRLPTHLHKKVHMRYSYNSYSYSSMLFSKFYFVGRRAEIRFFNFTVLGTDIRRGRVTQSLSSSRFLLGSRTCTVVNSLAATIEGNTQFSKVWLEWKQRLHHQPEQHDGVFGE